MSAEPNNCSFDNTEFLENHIGILDILLMDRTTKRNIIWGTDIYKRKGFCAKDVIKKEQLIGKYNPIKPRIEKSKIEQIRRSKDMAEVFTPSWVCNKQNNLIDDEWFGYIGAFNIEKDNTWQASSIVNLGDKNWKEYVSDIRMEITCGEAPYLVNRYDTVTGQRIDLFSRIGLFDRKMRIICENACSDDEWIEQSLIALKSVYGYEFQGDNLLIARENMLFSYIDYFFHQFRSIPNENLLVEVAEIISWNLWQMDGLKMVVPYSCHNEKPKYYQPSLFGDDEEPIEEMCPGCKINKILSHNGIRCYIMDWKKNKKIKFISLFRGSEL